MEHYGVLIKKLDKVFKQNFDQELERVGLTFSQMRVLRFLEDNPNTKITQKDISKELDIQHSTTIGLLKRMQEKGLVTVVVDEDNRRCRNIFLTSKAEEISCEMERGRTIMENRVVASFTEEEKEIFYRLLNKAIDNLKE
ncbi:MULTISPECIES: MarR family transcriptional regulator [unclassified Eubacterium (in: firmicutes)]|uniref:MarR family winged helix-turn-helix transcriptional regulator n=1 Tax=Eubacterium TaxID=1730 RepID=UPI000341476D|nr:MULTISPECIES: MarR family transcriptional regulator [unclassified Eubacterium (in: firmicutes)]RGG66613.1 MarR family transcriptional regulator [Eubacterium sp. AF17-7]RHR36515.1 MarR family transcriptional regulator [Eubacterium sp. AF19-12LB]CDA28170.1 marR family protein [Eubacterium sp. CAG:156]